MAGADTGVVDTNGTTASRRRESAAARALRPTIAWPTVGFAALVPALYVAAALFALLGILPLWIAILVMGVLAYAHYTLVHEAIHGNIFPAHDQLRWVESAIGWFGSLVLLNSYPMLRRTHLGHHAHTNTEHDPDIFVKGNFLALLAKWLVLCPFVLIPPELTKFIDRAGHDRLRSVLTKREWWIANATTSAIAIILIVACMSEQSWKFALLWFASARIGALLLNIFFRWLPHHPFEETSRYRNTRISFWVGGEIFLLWQNLHLIHHLWPGVPFYRYGRLFRDIRPILVSQRARLEGFLPGAVIVEERVTGPATDADRFR
jgi:fatty acid desaturase